MYQDRGLASDECLNPYKADLWWLRERKLARKTIKHATKGAISAPVRRITLNTREERELQRILYPLE